MRPREPGNEHTSWKYLASFQGSPTLEHSFFNSNKKFSHQIRCSTKILSSLWTQRLAYSNASSCLRQLEETRAKSLCMLVNSYPSNVSRVHAPHTECGSVWDDKSVVECRDDLVELASEPCWVFPQQQWPQFILTHTKHITHTEP